MGVLGASRHETHQAALTGTPKGLLMVSGIEVLLFGSLMGLSVWISRASRDDLMLRLRRPWLALLLGTGYSAGIRVALGILATLVAAVLVASHIITLDGLQEFIRHNRPDIETVVNVPALKHDRLYMVLTLTLVSFVVAGLREELWRAASVSGLRHLWPRLFGSQAGGCAAVVLTSVAFGLGHLPQGILAVGATALIGVALGCIMVLHRSTWVAVIAHGMFDATSFVLIAVVPEDLLKMPAALLHCILPLAF